MKTLALLFLAVSAQAAGPIYKHKDKYVEQEFRNVYQDIRAADVDDPLSLSGINVSTVTASSATITNLTVTNLTGVTLGKVIASSATTITASSSTTGTTLIDSGLSVTVTPTNTNQRVLVFAAVESLVLANAGQTMIGRFTINRGGSTVYDVARAAGSSSEVAGGLYSVTPLVYMDSPSTTSATTYKLQFARSSAGGTGTVFMNDGNSASTLVALVIAP